MPLDLRAGHGVYHQSWGGEARRALALHCTLGRSDAFEGMARVLPLTLTAFDLPGHGRSADWRGLGDYHGVCTDIAATFCDGATDVIGHSFGAAVALRLAIEHPGRVRTLTLIEPVFFAVARADEASEVTGHEADFAPFVAAMDAGDTIGAARNFTAQWGGGAPFDQLSARRQQALADRIHLVEAGAPGIEHDSGGLLTPGRIAGIAAPVLLVRGADSPAIVTAIHRGLLARLGDVTQTVVPSAGHMVALTHADTIANAMRARFSL